MATNMDSELEEPYPDSILVVGVKVRDRGEVKRSRTEDPSLVVGDHVMLRLHGHLVYGTVSTHPQTLQFLPPMRVMKRILRKATRQDEEAIARQQRLAKEGMEVCRERAQTLGIHMKLVEVYGSFQRRLLTFCYTAEERIDFRQLVKDLARHFSCRIEMQQISSRDEASLLSGVDTCGQVLCCATFLTDFEHVSLKPARGGSGGIMDNHRIGVCGRVKCCLMFEQDDWGKESSLNQNLIYPTRR